MYKVDDFVLLSGACTNYEPKIGKIARVFPPFEGQAFRPGEYMYTISYWNTVTKQYVNVIDVYEENIMLCPKQLLNIYLSRGKRDQPKPITTEDNAEEMF